jgi:hypothetical protein
VLDLGANYDLSNAYLWQMVQQNELLRGLKEFRLLASPNAPNPADAANPPAMYDLTGFTEILGVTTLAASGQVAPAPTQAFAVANNIGVRTIYLDVISSYNTGPRIDIGAVEYFLDGDYDLNASVNGRDFLAWQRQFGSAVSPHGSGADGNRDGIVDAADLAVWADSYGEPSTVAATSAEAVSFVRAEANDGLVAVAAQLAETHSKSASTHVAFAALAQQEANLRSRAELRPKSRAALRTAPQTAALLANVKPSDVRLTVGTDTRREVDAVFDLLGDDAHDAGTADDDQALTIALKLGGVGLRLGHRQSHTA